MSEQILEKKSSQDFLRSDKYAVLQKEIIDSVASVNISERGTGEQDLSPAFDYFKKETTKNGLSEIQAETLFWQTVAETIKKTRFRSIYEDIRPYIESGDYAQARLLLTEEWKKIIEQLSPTLYRSLSRRSSALMVLKEKFYGMFLEIEALLEGTEEEKRAKIKIPKGIFTDRLEETNKASPLLEDEFHEWPGYPSYLVEDQYWRVPDHRELVSGLVIAFEDREEQRIEVMEFLDIPHLGRDGDFWVKVRWNGGISVINLADFGLLAYSRSGLWNSRYIAKRWGMNRDKR